jgi:coenzyme PQQ precursor peptide PqqA
MRKPGGISPGLRRGEILMKIWTKPAVREQEVGLEVTSYLPAEIDVI